MKLYVYASYSNWKYNSELSGLRNAQQKCIKWAYMHGEKNASLFAHFQLGTKKG